VKGPIAIRLILTAVIIALTYSVLFAWKKAKPPEVVFPSWCHLDNDLNKPLNINLPYQLGGWSGTKAELDPKIFDATEARVAENRNYLDESGNAVSLHIAYFDNLDAGVEHCPTNCYRCSGFQCRQETKTPLEDVSPPRNVWFTRWAKEDRTGNAECFVVFWYDLDGTTLYDRFDLGIERMRRAGRPTWPPLIKILIQGRMGVVSQQERERVMNLARQIELWLTEQARSGGEVDAAKAAPEKSAPATKSKEPANSEK
jgi:hypothetical protein